MERFDRSGSFCFLLTLVLGLLLFFLLLFSVLLQLLPLFSFCFEVCIQLVSIIVIIKTLMGSTGFFLLSSRSTLLVKGGEKRWFMSVVSSPFLLQKPLDSTYMPSSWSFAVVDAVNDTKNHSSRVIDLIFLTSHCILLPSLNT